MGREEKWNTMVQLPEVLLTEGDMRKEKKCAAGLLCAQKRKAPGVGMMYQLDHNHGKSKGGVQKACWVLGGLGQNVFWGGCCQGWGATGSKKKSHSGREAMRALGLQWGYCGGGAIWGIKSLGGGGWESKTLHCFHRGMKPNPERAVSATRLTYYFLRP